MDDTVNITLLGGVNEVGGNIVLLEDFSYDIKILIDFGIKIGKYYEQYERGQHPSSIDELKKLKLIPNEESLPINNLYTQIWSKFKLKKRSRNAEEEEASIDQIYPSNLEGILISHAHKDHYFGLSFVNRTIPIYTGVITKKIIEAFFKSAKFRIDNNYANLNWKTFRTGDIIDIKGMKIIPYHVDHSVPASYGFIIYTSAGPVVYTGDFRRHGPLSSMTEDFLNEIKANEIISSNIQLNAEQKQLISDGVKVLICEGTRIHKGIVESEERVESHLEKIFENNPFDFILVKYDRIDWDRFRTFSHIAKKYGWKYIITEKEAYFYHLLNKEALHETMRDPNILEDDHIYILKKGAARFPWQEKIRQIMYNHQKGDRFLDYHDLKDLEKEFFIYITHLHPDLVNNLNFNLNGLFLSSSIDPYSEEFYDNTKTIGSELKHYGIPCYRVHASGHAIPHDLINFICEVNPRYLIPIHTEHPEFFGKIFDKTDIKVVEPQLNKPIAI